MVLVQGMEVMGMVQLDTMVLQLAVLEKNLKFQERLTLS